MTIHEIKKLTEKTAPHFFDRDTMRFFGQSLNDFTVKKQSDGKYRISCPSGDNWEGNHETVRYFNPENNVLELEQLDKKEKYLILSEVSK